MEFLALLVVIFVAFWLNSKILQLQYEVEVLKKQLGVSKESTPTPLYKDETPGRFAPVLQGQSAPIAPVATAQMSPVPPPPPPSSQNTVGDWLMEDILLKLGALLLLIGFGWFVSYAFMNNWVGPVGRISLGLLAGVAVLGVGTWRIPTYKHQGSVFLVLGSGVILLTLFAARELYEFLTPMVSLALMFMSVVYVALMSVLYKSNNLALAGLLMAAIAPHLTNTPEPSVLGIMSYLLVVVVGTVWIVRMTGNHVLTFAAVIMMVLYSLPFMGGGVAVLDERVALFFSFIFAAIFFVANTVSIIMVQTEKARKTHLATAVATGLYLVMWISMVVSPAMQSLAYVFWMLVFSVGTFFVFTQTENKIPFYLYGAVALSFLFAATAAELSGPVLTLAYTIQVAAIALTSRFVLPAKVSQSLGWLFGLPILLSLESFVARSWDTGFLHADFLILSISCLSLGLVGLIYMVTKQDDDSSSYLAGTLLGISFFYFVSLVWLVLHSVLIGDVATTLALIIYTILGVGLLVIGRLNESKYIQSFGGVLLGAVIIRLFVIDIWQMNMVGRIITFFAVGLLLISTAFMGKKKSNPPQV